MTSPQRHRAAATPTASPEGVTAELLPCPFCGSAGAIFERGISAPLTAYYGYCSNEECGAETNGYTDKSEAVAAWNRRTPALAAQAQRRDEVVEALRAALEPFVEAERELFNDWCPDETPAWYHSVDGFDAPSPVTVGDFRRAKTALNTPEPK